MSAMHHDTSSDLRVVGSKLRDVFEVPYNTFLLSRHFELELRGIEEFAFETSLYRLSTVVGFHVCLETIEARHLSVSVFYLRELKLGGFLFASIFSHAYRYLILH